jgi:hypothetical protein
MRIRSFVLLFVAACSSASSAPIGGDVGDGSSSGDGGGASPDDAGGSSSSGGSSSGGSSSGGSSSGGSSSGDAATLPDAGGSTGALGTVSNVVAGTCPSGLPAGTTCQVVTVSGCPGLATETLTATVGLLAATGTAKGTVIHLKGGGGQGVEDVGAANYAAAGLRQVFVSWDNDWETTTSAGIKAAACRPATVMKWIFDTVHGGSRTDAFCGQGHSAGSAQLGYALAQYGMGDYFDYVNELSGPPFARIDLGCDGDAPPTATVCGVTDTMQLPGMLNGWENIASPLTCGAKNVPAAELTRWKNDSIAIGGVYTYPKTDVQFFDCTNNATAVTAMAQIFEGVIAQAEGSSGMVGYHCFSQADGCSGEGLGPRTQEAIDSLVAGCTPRH